MTTQVQSEKTQQGFSLIELLVVVAIIGVLAAAGVVGYTSYLDNVKSDTHRNNTLSIGKALSLNAVAKNGNLQVNPTECNGTNTDGDATKTSVQRHESMLTCIRKIAQDAKFKSPFAPGSEVTSASIASYIVEAPTRNTAFSATATNQCSNAVSGAGATLNEGKILVHHDTAAGGRMKTTVFACNKPTAGNPSTIITDSVVQVDYLN